MWKHSSTSTLRHVLYQQGPGERVMSPLRKRKQLAASPSSLSWEVPLNHKPSADAPYSEAKGVSLSGRGTR